MKLSRQFYNNVSQVVLLGVMLAVVVGGTNLRIISLNTRTLITLLAALAFGIILWISAYRRENLHSPADYGWIALLLLTGLAVLFAPFPRRSIEHWILTIGIQAPFAYATILLFRRVRIERIAAVYRAILGVGAYLFLLAAIFTLSYFAQIDPQADYIPGFRLWGVLDNPSILGMFIAIALPCAVGYLFTRRTRSERVLIVVWLLGALLTIVGNATRSAFIATVIGAAVSLVLVVLAHPSKPLVKLRLRLIARRTQTLVQLGLAGGLISALIVGIFAVQSAAPNHAPASSRFELYGMAVQAFFERPITGYGAGGYVLALQQYKSTPPYILVPHAHNMILDVVAEYGIAGLAGLAIFILAAAYTCIGAWRTQEIDDHRVLLAGLIGGLVGFLASGLLEQPMAQTGLFFLVTVLLMTIASRIPARSQITQGWSWLVLMVNALIVGVALMLLAFYTQFWNTIQPNPATGEVDWQKAAESLDALHSADPNDPLVALQTAYAWANQPDNSHTQQAIERFQAAMLLDPQMSMHPLNLAALYARLGDYDNAITMAQHSTELAPEHATAWLNLGIYHEQAGNQQEATAAYSEALQWRPDWLRSTFWDTSELRIESVSNFSSDGAVAQFYRLIHDGDLSRDRNDVRGALKFYEDALIVAESMDGRLQPFYEQTARGLMALINGDTDGARRELLPLALGFVDMHIINVDAWIYLGDVYGAMGDEARMIECYRQAYISLTTLGFGGYRTQGDVTYSINAFRRLGVVSDYLPDVVQIDISVTHQARFDRWLDLQQPPNSN